MIEIKSLGKRYGKVEALRGINLTVKEGEVLGLIGPNGAGKTTLLKIIVGLVEPSYGSVSIRGRTSSWNVGVGYLPENVVFYDNLTAAETLKFFARIKDLPYEKCSEVLKKVGLEGVNRRVGSFSKGMRQRLGLATALLGDPDILIMDEPTSGLDPLGIRLFQSIVREQKTRGATIIISSHSLREIQDIVDRVGIMNNGSMLAVGEVSELLESLELKWVVKARIEGEAKHLLKKFMAMDAEVEVSEDLLVVRCSSRDRFKVLSILAKSEVEFEIERPSLEDVFIKLVERVNYSTLTDGACR